ncbi:hypothetical protein GXW78_18240 [Roseomonas terrae]|uniref:KfrA N-terminal DNA-binding domain-containing protein n=1 Tax=Neoroseomonas terrae TaxID=424799 RepID=A0ABS5EKS1_9PROT|nr:hypothetical protein [Neoroseomonas terrae]MBR0651616.1 hypothetical protein [Neoroseomonas terrae]
MASETDDLIDRIAALAAEAERLRTVPRYAGRADEVAKALDAAKAKLAAVLAGLSGEVAAADAAKTAAAEKRSADAVAAGKAGGAETARRRAAGFIGEPREIEPPIWEGDDEPPIEWRTSVERAILHRRRLAGPSPNMTQILRAVAAASGLTEATMRRRWFGSPKTRKAILALPLFLHPPRRKDDG